MDARLQRIKDLIELKEKTDTELDQLLGGAKLPKTRVCSICNADGHTARTCPSKQEQQ